jgi:Leucine Rich repeat
MTSDQPSTTAYEHPTLGPKPRRKNRRLQVLLALNALALGLFIFVRLDRSAVEYLGPAVVGIHDLFNQVPGSAAPLTAAGRRLVEDVKTLGGEASVSVLKPGFLGTIGQTEWSNVSFRNPEFDDKALARLAEMHGDRIGGLYLDNTGITDAGLRSLSKITMLRHLVIRNYRRRPGTPELPPTITDAGLIHLKGLDHLWSLDLSGLPITDAGLKAIDDLPELMSLYLGRTKVQGLGLARMKSLPRWSVLYLDGSAMTEDGLNALAGATQLQMLSLKQVPLTPAALPLLKALPRVDRVELSGCGFLDEEIDALVTSKPGLRVERR